MEVPVFSQLMCIYHLLKAKLVMDVGFDGTIIDERSDIGELLANTLLTLAEQHRQNDEYDPKFKRVGVHG